MPVRWRSRLDRWRPRSRSRPVGGEKHAADLRLEHRLEAPRGPLASSSGLSGVSCDAVEIGRCGWQSRAPIRSARSASVLLLAVLIGLHVVPPLSRTRRIDARPWCSGSRAYRNRSRSAEWLFLRSRHPPASGWDASFAASAGSNSSLSSISFVSRPDPAPATTNNSVYAIRLQAPARRRPDGAGNIGVLERIRRPTGGPEPTSCCHNQACSRGAWDGAVSSKRACPTAVEQKRERPGTSSR